jgi:hypothetical protein
VPIAATSKAGVTVRPVAVEFGVHETPRPETLGHAVVGRVMRGTVRVDDVFTEAEGPRDVWTEPSPLKMSVLLRVREVRRYGQLLDEAEEVHSAELLVEGTGMELVGDLVMLRHHAR